MNVTDYFKSLVSQELVDEYNTQGPYKMWDSGSAEVEVLELLYALVRIMKPQNVLETGSHKGWSAGYMAQGLKDNGFGHLDTLEYLPEYYQMTLRKIEDLLLKDYVLCHSIDAKDFIPTVNYQIIFIDTEPETRFKEFIKFYPHLDDGGIMMIHDLGSGLHQIEVEGKEFGWPFGKLPDKIKQLIKNKEIQSFHFPSPRGLWVVQKKKEGFYE
jgi:predicted O-methyltransferase YrrM